jgi:hypothetical protein
MLLHLLLVNQRKSALYLGIDQLNRSAIGAQAMHASSKSAVGFKFVVLVFYGVHFRRLL